MEILWIQGTWDFVVLLPIIEIINLSYAYTELASGTPRFFKIVFWSV